MNLPLELLVEIFSWCGLNDLLRLGLTNKVNYFALKQNRLWLVLCQKLFNLSLSNTINAFEIYWYHHASRKLVESEFNSNITKSVKRVLSFRYRIIRYKFDPNRINQTKILCRNSYERKQAHQLASQLGLFSQTHFNQYHDHFNQTLIERESGISRRRARCIYSVSLKPMSHVLITRKEIPSVDLERPEERVETIIGFGSCFAEMKRLKLKWQGRIFV